MRFSRILVTRHHTRLVPTSLSSQISLPGRYPSRAEWDVVDLGDGGTVAGDAEQVSSLPNLPSPVPAVDALEKVLRKLAKRLQAEGRLNLKEAFIGATFAAAKKGAWG